MKENFVVINFFNDNFETTVLRVDFVNKTISFVENFKFSESNLIPTLKKLFSFVFYPRPYKVILIFSPRDAASYCDIVSVKRDNRKEKMSKEELDELVSGAVWKIFEKNRSRASRQLRLGETELILSDVSVYDFKVDGHRVVDPLKELAGRVEMSFSQTFARREFLSKVLRLLPKRANKVFVLEGGTSASHLLMRASKNDKFVFAKTGSEKTDIFLVDKGEICFSDYFSWGENSIYKGISSKLKVNISESKSIVEMFLDHKTSPYFFKNFGNLFADEVITLIQGLKSGIVKIKGSLTYLDFPSFEKFLKEGLKLKNVSTKMVIPVDSAEIFENFDFEIKGQLLKTKKLDFLTAAALLKVYFLPTPSYPLSLINRLAKRKMRWLIPN